MSREHAGSGGGAPSRGGGVGPCGHGRDADRHGVWSWIGSVPGCGLGSPDRTPQPKSPETISPTHPRPSRAKDTVYQAVHDLVDTAAAHVVAEDLSVCAGEASLVNPAYTSQRLLFRLRTARSRGSCMTVRSKRPATSWRGLPTRDRPLHLHTRGQADPDQTGRTVENCPTTTHKPPRPGGWGCQTTHFQNEQQRARSE
jgi:hypothetical protein